MKNFALFSTGNDKHSTPQWLFNELHDEFHFDVDVCATIDDTKCEKFFSPEEDGLEKEWSGTCWMNPPYGKNVIKWTEKAYESSLCGATVVALLPARTDTQWFHKYVYRKAEIRFIEGRLKFGDSKNSAPFPSMIVIWRPLGQSKVRVETLIEDIFTKIRDFARCNSLI